MEWSQFLLDSYRHWVGKELVARVGDETAQAQRLFEASCIVVSHGVEPDPVDVERAEIAADAGEHRLSCASNAAAGRGPRNDTQVGAHPIDGDGEAAAQVQRRGDVVETESPDGHGNSANQLTQLYVNYC